MKDKAIRMALENFRAPLSSVLWLLLGLGLLLFKQVGGALLLGKTVDIAVGQSDGNLGLWLGGYLSVIILSSFGQYLALFYKRKISEHVAEFLRIKTFKKVLSLPYLESTKLSQGDAMNRFSSDVEVASATISEVIIPIISTALTIIISLLVCINISPIMSILVLISAIAVPFASDKLSNGITNAYSEMQDQSSICQSSMQEMLQRMAVIKMFMLEEDQVDNYGQLAEKKKVKSIFLTKKQSVLAFICGSLAFFPHVTSYALGGYLVMEKALSIGVLLTFLNISGSMVFTFKEISDHWSQLSEKKGAWLRLEELWSEEDEQDIAAVDKADVDKLTVENICFSYLDGENVLENISFTAQVGLTAIKGSSGSGKSTLAKLLLGLINPKSGKIKMGDKVVSGQELRNFISYVPQGNNILSGTVHENICCGRSASEEEVIYAAKKANIHDFILTLPQGYQTILGEDLKLSEGQAQRISIARALLLQKPILLLDEASSALDRESEMEIIKTMREVAISHICIFIAHRPDMLEIANTTIELRGGRLNESAA